MSQLQQNTELQALNTFGVDARADYLLELSSPADWADYADSLPASQPKLVLGGGSNLLFLSDFHGLLIKPAMSGIETEDAGSDQVLLRVGAGENWHQLVRHCIAQGWYGLENLSLIRGLVGAAPVQNIGAYGVEVKDRIEAIELLDLSSGEQMRWSNQDCEFGYRDSRLKRAGQGKYLVTGVEFRLDRVFHPVLSYQPLQHWLAEQEKLGAAVDALAVSDAVCAIRRSKLPDPAVLPNAGSFFKNPVVSESHWQTLMQRWPNLVSYPADGGYKLAAGWLIEQAGLKGWRNERVGVHSEQALVLVNHNHGQGRDIWALAQMIMQRVEDQFAVQLEPEVRLIGNDLSVQG